MVFLYRANIALFLTGIGSMFYGASVYGVAMSAKAWITSGLVGMLVAVILNGPLWEARKKLLPHE